MWRRIRVFMFGVGLGLIVTWALVLRNRNTDEYLKWMPNERILEEIRIDSNTVLPPNFDCLLGCLDVTSLDYEQLTLEGRVNFEKSSPRETPKVYLVEHETENGILTAVYEFTGDEQHLVELYRDHPSQNCNCHAH